MTLKGKMGAEIQNFIKEKKLKIREHETSPEGGKSSSRKSLRGWRRISRVSSLRNHLLQFGSEELAQQFTVIEHQMFSVIPVHEFWNACWTK